MKKKVRIYKAQDGGQPSVQMLGYPGAQQKQQLTEEQLLQTIANDISQGLPNEAITIKLVNQMGLEPNIAQQYISYVNQMLQQQEEPEEEEEEEDVDVENELPDTSFTSTKMTPLEDSSDLALEENDELYDEDQTFLQRGGEYGDFVTNMYKQGMYNFGENITPSVMPETPEFKLGGYKTKKGYVNNVMKLVKKQLGGQDKASANDADPIGEDMRNNTLGAFVNSVKREGNLHLAKEKAEQEYEQKMQEFQMMMTPQQEVLQNYIPEAQFGMFLPRGMFNRGRQLRPFMGNPAMTAGMNPFVSKLDVRRSGIFGRPRQYSIEYNNPFQMMQGMPNFAGMFPGMFPGMFSKKVTKTPGRLITETKAKTVNAEANKEVAANTPGNTATNKPEETVVTEISTTNTSGTPETSSTSNASTGSQKSNSKKQKSNEEVITETENVTQYKKPDFIGLTANERNALHTYPGRKNARYLYKDGKLYIAPNFNSQDNESMQFYEITDKKRKQILENEFNKQTQKRTLEQFKELENNANAKDPAKYFNPNTGRYEYRSMAAQADDDLISTLALGVLNYAPVAGEALGLTKLLGPSGAKNFLGAGIKALPKGTPALNAGQKMLNPGQKMLNPPPGMQYKMPFEYGGLVNNPMPDEYGNLQRFVYGGDDEFTEADMYGTNSIDTTDPYFKYGGLTKYAGDKEGSETDENYCYQGATNCFPKKTDNVDTPWTVSNPNNVVDNFNPRFGSSVNDRQPKEKTDYEAILAEEKKKWEQEYMQKMLQPMYSQLNPAQFMGINPMSMYNPFFGVNTKMKKGPFNPMTGQAIMDNPYGANTYIKSIDVKRSGLMGNPKKYTINYGNNLTDSRNRPLASASTTPSTQGVKSFENQIGRQRPWYLGKKWETDFEDVARPVDKTEKDPYAGFPLDHPIRSEQKLKINSVIDYLKPSQTASSKLIGAKYDLNGNPVSSTSASTTAPRVEANGRPIGNTAYEQRNRAMSPSPEKLDALYKRDVFNDYKYGGLHKFLPQANPGVETPVTQDERLMLPTISSQQAGKQLFDQSFEDMASKAKFAEQPEDFSVTYKNKMGLGDQLKYGVQGADLLMQGATRGLNALDENKRERQLMQNYDSTNLYAMDSSIDRGDYETNSGLFQPSDMGNVRDSFSKQFGGTQDEFEYMTDDEIEEFIANGGELEFVDDEESEEY